MVINKVKKITVMKKYNPILISLVSMLTMWSCTGDNDATGTADEGPGIVDATTVAFTEQDVPESEETRSSLIYQEGVSGLKFQWTAGDQLGIFSYDASTQKTEIARYDIISSTAGAASSKFQNESFALIEGGRYFGFYPYSVLSGISDVTKATLDYTGQRQTANSSNAHVNAYDYQVAMAHAYSNTASFQFSPIGSVLHVKMKVPEAGTFKELNIKSSDGYDFKMTRTIDLTDGNQSTVANYAPKFDPTNAETGTSNVITLLLGDEQGNGISVAADGILDMFVMIPATSELAGKTMYAILKDATGSGKDYYCTYTGKAYSSTTMYTIGRVAHEVSVITEDIEIYKDWQNGTVISTTRTTGDPGTTETLDKPKYLTVYTCGDGKVIDVYNTATAESDWTATDNGWKYKTRELNITPLPTQTLNVYAVASNEDVYDKSVKVGTKESIVQGLTFNNDSQYMLANTYAVSCTTSDFGNTITDGGIIQATAKLYHVAAKVDVNWDYPSKIVGDITVNNLLKHGYIFKPTSNASQGTDKYTLRTASVDQQHYGREYFYTLQTTSPKLNLTTTIGGTTKTADINLTPGTNEGYTSWFRVNIK